MKLAVLPLNTAEGTSPALGRQIINFACDIARANTGGEINAVSYLTQVEEDGQSKSVFANVADALLEREWLDQIFQQTEVDFIVDGLLKVTDGNFEWTMRVHEKESAEPIQVDKWSFGFEGFFAHLDKLIQLLEEKTGLESKRPVGASLHFGTDSPEAFAKFLEGYDAHIYAQQAMAQVTIGFSPKDAIDLLMEALRLDPNFVAPADTIIQFCRLCATYRIGTFEVLAAALVDLAKLIPGDFKPPFALGEIYMSVGQPAQAADHFEAAVALQPDEPELYARLAMAQMGQGMPVNAERNLRKAFELEGPEKPSAELLANVLAKSGRIHEVPDLWKSIIELNDQNGYAHARYGVSLVQMGKVEQGEQAFELALEILHDNLVVKRFYAPYLVDKGDMDRAMDFYEDCLDHSPNDIDVLFEYAQTLQKADREFEVPRVLRDILASTPDPNTRAVTLAWLTEIEQPKRVENVMDAQAKMDAGDFDTAIRELRPLKNWLGDYWRLWALLASSLNGIQAYEEAEEAARRLLQLYPGCEPGYGELASALVGQGKREEAYAFMTTAAINMPQSLPVHLSLAVTAKKAGHEDHAKSLVKSIREAIGPNEELEPILVEIEA